MFCSQNKKTSGSEMLDKIDIMPDASDVYDKNIK